MKVMQRTALVLALAGALAIPATTLLAGEPPAQDEHGAHQSDAVQTPASTPVDMQAMRDRMREIRQTRDPKRRKALIKAQMKDMETLMQDPKLGCPMADGKSGGMLGSGMGMDMMGGKGGMDMMG
jgi:hypothetical protein